VEGVVGFGSREGVRSREKIWSPGSFRFCMRNKISLNFGLLCLHFTEGNYVKSIYITNYLQKSTSYFAIYKKVLVNRKSNYIANYLQKSTRSFLLFTKKY
jgi:hypothetical protein